VRWSRKGIGKRGGARVVYFYYNTPVPIYVLAAYAKAKQEDLSPTEKATLSKYVAILKAEWRSRKRT
jgi:hypothetical protein